MKPLIDSSKDLVNNPQGLFGDKLPWFSPLDKDNSPYRLQRGAQNYGIFMTMQMANRRFLPIINAIRDVIEEKPDAMETLKEIYNQYK